MAPQSKIPSGWILVEVTLVNGDRRRAIFSGTLHERHLLDTRLFKQLGEDNQLESVDFAVGDIQLLTVTDKGEDDDASMLDMAPYLVTLKSGKTYTIHCSRINKASWITGMLESAQGLQRGFINFEAVAEIRKISAAIAPDPPQPSPESAGTGIPSPENPIGERSAPLFITPDRFDAGIQPDSQEQRLQPLLERLNKQGVVDYITLGGLLNIDPGKLRHKVRLGDFLVREGMLSTENLKKGLALREKERKSLLGEILVKHGWLSEFALAVALAVQFRLPFTLLAPESVEDEASRLFSPQQAMEHEAIPFKLVNNLLLIAVANPGLEDIHELSFILNKNVSLVVTTKQSVHETIRRIYGRPGTAATANLTQELYFDELVGPEESVDTIVARGKEAPIVSLVNQIIIDGVERKASDIHIIPEKKYISVAYRINGIIQKKTNLNKNVLSYVVARIKILGGMNIIERRLPQDGRIHGRARDQTVDIRVSILPAQYGETVVLRLRYPDKQLPDLADLGFTEAHLELVRQNISRSKGMILVTGPTGSGKSTTLISFLKAVLELPQKLHIITVEDPIELEVPGLTQVPVNSAIGMTFPRILRNILRHDPDVIMIGEIRDQETAKIAIQAALTGHLVFSTLHTNDALSTLTRLEDMGIEPFLVGTSVNLVLAQRLVKTLCDCAEAYLPESGDQVLLAGFGFRLAADQHLRRPKGCPKCDQSGYRGRCMIYELLVVDKDIRALNLKEANQSGALRKILATKGFTPLLHHGLTKVVTGEVYLPEIMQHWEG